MKNKITAVEWLAEKYNYVTWMRNRDEVSASMADEWLKHYLEQAKQIERTQHGNTWDAAIKAHDDRGHVYSRSITDFDNYQVGVVDDLTEKLDQMISEAKNNYKTNKYRSYRECYEAGVDAMAELIRNENKPIVKCSKTVRMKLQGFCIKIQAMIRNVSE